MSDKSTISNVESAVIIPALQSAVTGALAAAAGFSAGFVFDFDPWAAGGLAGSVVCMIAWLIFRGQWLESLHLALGGNPTLQAAPAEIYQAETVRIELAQYDSGGYGGLDWLELPLRLEAVIGMAAAWQRLGDPYRFITSQIGGRGKVATRSEAEVMRDFLIERELAFRANGAANATVSLSWQGRAVLRHLAELGGRDRKNSPTPRTIESLRGLLSQGSMQTHTHAQTALGGGAY